MTGKTLQRLVLLLCVLPGSAVSADNPAGSGGHAMQQKYAGSYDTDAFLNEPAVRTSLARLLGGQLQHLLDNLDVRGEVDLVSGSLSLSGNAAHSGGIEEAVVCVSTYDGSVSAAVFSNGIITVYAQHPDYVAQGLCIKDWITLVNSGHRDRSTQPANVRFAPVL